MHRCLKVLLLVLVLVSPYTKVFPQCEVPPKTTLLIGADATAGRDTIFFGHHPLATRGRDTVFCERELPPMPPPTIFELRFVNPPGYEGIQPPAGMGQGFYYDFRPQVSPTQIDTHRVRFQPGPGGYPMTFTWSPSQLLAMCDSAHLRDEFGGAFFSARMHIDTVLVVTNSAITTLLLYKFGTVETPAAPVLSSPPDGAVQQPIELELAWNNAFGAAKYRVQVASDAGFSQMVLDNDNTTSTFISVGSLLVSTTYYWRVNATNASGTSAWSAVWSFTTASSVTNSYPVAAGWNMISLPLAVGNPVVSSVFPQAVSSAFAFGSTGYVASDSLLSGKGYWLKFTQAESVAITGVPVVSDTIGIVAGWNLIGAISSPVDTGDVIQVPADIVISPFFGYDGGYGASSILEPGQAYWVKASASGVVILQSTSTQQPRSIPSNRK